ncbi:MAG: hypothetical protein E7032_02705 [Akkermansiaceae bacterium]|nr:hypothetical protein [Akkermansiaceae bacterium]
MVFLYIIHRTPYHALYAQYKELADQEPDVIFGGRLAEYKYYDMAPIIERVLSLFNVREP